MGDRLEECKSNFFPIEKIVDRKNTLREDSTIYLQNIHLSVLQVMEYQNFPIPLIKIWTRGQILAQKSTFSELPQNERECSPHRHKPNAICFVSNGHREKEIFRSVRIAKQEKKRTLTRQSVQADVAEVTWLDCTC
jgi:hypothetical protein